MSGETYSPRTTRFRRTFVTGMRALGVEEDEAQWEAFREGRDVDGPFEELLNEGKIDEALSIFRAHVPFGETDIQTIPQILERALPNAVAHRLSETSLQNLLFWVEEEISPYLVSEDAKQCLIHLTNTVSRDMAHKALTFENEASGKPQITRMLTIALSVARCSAPAKGQNKLEKVLDETLKLYNEHNLLRPARVLLLCDDDNEDNEGFNKRFDSDVENMLLRGVDNIDEEMKSSIRPWCEATGTNPDEALFSFLANPELESDERWCALLDYIEDPRIRTRATLLLIRKASPPFPEYVWETLRQAKIRDAAESELWEKEARAMDIRQVAAKYDPRGMFDLSRHLKPLQMHICAYAAGTRNLADFEQAFDDARFVSASYDSPLISSLILQQSATAVDSEDEENDYLFEEATKRIHIAMRRLSPSEKYSVCQELIQYCMMICEDDDEFLDREEQRQIFHRTSVYGICACRYLSNELDSTSTYLNVEDYEERFTMMTYTNTNSSNLNTSTSCIMVDGMSSNNATSEPQDCSELDRCRMFTMKCTESELASACNILGDALLLYDIRISCENSQQRRDHFGFGNGPDFSQLRFRDCPNILNGRDIVPRLQMALDTSRRQSSLNSMRVLKRNNDFTGKEIESLIKILDSNGAGQAALRLKIHARSRQLRQFDTTPDLLKQQLESDDDIVFRLASTALQRTYLDEALILGYLLSLNRKHSATLLFRAESKRLNDAFTRIIQGQEHDRFADSKEFNDSFEDEDEGEFDFLRFERLSALGKQIGKAFCEKHLLEESDRTEKLAKWILKLQTVKNMADLNRYKFITLDRDYLKSVGNDLFASMFTQTDYSFTLKKLEIMREYFADFMTSKGNTVETRLAESIVDLLCRESLNLDVALLADPLILWAKESDQNSIIPKLNEISLTYPLPWAPKIDQETSPASQRRMKQSGKQNVLGSDHYERLRIILDILLALKPEEETFIKRAQLLGLGGGKEVEFLSLLKNPCEELLLKKRNRGNELQYSSESGENAEVALLSLVCTALDKKGERKTEFLIDYIDRLIRTFPSSSFHDEIQPLLGEIGVNDSFDNEILELAELASRELITTKGRMEALVFIFRRKRQLKTSKDELRRLLDGIRKIEVRYIWEQWSITFDDSELDELCKNLKTTATQDELKIAIQNIVRVLFERADFSKEHTELFEAGKVLAGGNSGILVESLRHLILDWLKLPPSLSGNSQARLIVSDDEKENNKRQHSHTQKQPSQSSTVSVKLFSSRVSEANKMFEQKLVKIIVRALQCLGGDSSFLRKYALGTSKSHIITSISRARALRALKEITKNNPGDSMTKEELDELWRRERMAELEECKLTCKIWQQTAEQIFSDEVNKHQAVKGLLRDVQAADSKKGAWRCLLLIAKLIEDFNLYEETDSLLESTCLALVDLNDDTMLIEVLEIMLRCPVEQLNCIRSRKIWDSLIDAFTRAIDMLLKTDNGDWFSIKRVRQGFTGIACLLERCPFDDIAREGSEQLIESLKGIKQVQFLQRRFESLLSRFE